MFGQPTADSPKTTMYVAALGNGGSLKMLMGLGPGIGWAPLQRTVPFTYQSPTHHHFDCLCKY